MIDTNQKSWNNRRLARWYRENTYLQPAEQAALGRLSLRGVAVLDLGVGGGRTTAHFEGLAGRYVGIDAARQMVAAARRRHPWADIRLGDARDLSAFPDGGFDLVLFSFNGIDYVAWEDRPAVLREVHRVLRPGGHFLFSAHNLHALDEERPGRWAPPAIVWSWHPVRLVQQALSCAVGYRNYRRLAPAARRGPGFAVVNDGAHDYAFLTCYVDPGAQREALVAAGFSPEIALYGRDGLPAAPASRDAWIHYLAQRHEDG